MLSVSFGVHANAVLPFPVTAKRPDLTEQSAAARVLAGFAGVDQAGLKMMHAECLRMAEATDLTAKQAALTHR
jgi:hypothetical protein